jgi:hypothetical protein
VVLSNPEELTRLADAAPNFITASVHGPAFHQVRRFRTLPSQGRHIDSQSMILPKAKVAVMAKYRSAWVKPLV